MPGMVSRSSAALVGLVLVCLLTVSGAVAQTGYSISSPDSSPVPERSFDLQGDTHTINSHISAAPGDEITVEVSAPDEVYRVYLYNSDEQIVDRQRGEGDGTFTFDLTDYEPGSYAITTHSSETDQHEAVVPLLVEGYDVSVDAPSSVSAGESFDVTIDASAAAESGEPASVSAVIAADGDEHTVTANGNDGTYTATIGAGELDAGEYTVYGVVQGTDQAFDQKELLGLAEGGSLTVEAASEGTAGEGGDDDAGGGGVGPGGETSTETATGTATGTATATATDSVNGTATEDSSTETTQTTTEQAATTETTETETQTTEDDAAITPDDSTTAAATTDGAGPGFTGIHLAVALGTVLGVVVLRRRARTE